MKLLTLLTLLAIVYSERLAFDSTGATPGIKSYNFQYENKDGKGSTAIGTYVDDMGAIINDDKLGTETGYMLDKLGSENGWGQNGVSGTFMADELVPGIGNMYFKISTMSISFMSDGCVDVNNIEASAFYYAEGSTTKNIIDSTTITSADDSSGNYEVFTITATVNGNVNNNMGIGFDITKLGNPSSYQTCAEGRIEITDFRLDGEAMETTFAPTAAPTESLPPTISPSTSTPTMAPTRRCTGEITWGDPHYHLMAFDRKVNQLNYQGLGWYYYIFPCEMKNYKNWPFFLQSKHFRCYWKGNKKGCIGGNRLIINTHPNPWIIRFTNKHLEIEPGSDKNGYTSDSFDTDKFKKYKRNNPWTITYDDEGTAPGYLRQTGTLEIYYENNDIVLTLSNVLYNGKPRTCDKGNTENEACPEEICTGEVIEIRNQGSWTVYSCPNCLRNIACGIGGRFYRGDCTRQQIRDPGNDCYHVLVGSDGEIYTPPYRDSVFATFADTWHEDKVAEEIQKAGHNALYVQDRNALHLSDRKVAPVREGRAGDDLQVVDTQYYDGKCKGDMVEIQRINDTCRQHTVVKYDKCCKEIGICPILWKACIEDLCSCVAPNGNNTMTEVSCLDLIIHESMNTTCSWDRLYPTATPTNSPTKQPTGLVEGLKPGQKAMQLIWLYLIFVVIFVLIAGAAYWYYRKKNKGLATFPEDEEQAEKRDMEMGAADTTTYA